MKFENIDNHNSDSHAVVVSCLSLWSSQLILFLYINILFLFYSLFSICPFLQSREGMGPPPLSFPWRFYFSSIFFKVESSFSFNSILILFFGTINFEPPTPTNCSIFVNTAKFNFQINLV